MAYFPPRPPMGTDGRGFGLMSGRPAQPANVFNPQPQIPARRDPIPNLAPNSIPVPGGGGPVGSPLAPQNPPGGGGPVGSPLAPQNPPGNVPGAPPPAAAPGQLTGPQAMTLGNGGAANPAGTSMPGGTPQSMHEMADDLHPVAPRGPGRTGGF